MLITQFDKFVNRSTQEILGSEIERENLVPMLSSDIVRNGGDVTGVKGNAEIYYRTGNVNLTPADLGALDTDNVYNGLDETSEGYALDARQGKVLNESIDDKLDKANVYNGLDKTAAGYALDARQGKVLNDKIDAIQQSMTIEEYSTTLTTSKYNSFYYNNISMDTRNIISVIVYGATNYTFASAQLLDRQQDGNMRVFGDQSGGVVYVQVVRKVT